MKANQFAVSAYDLLTSKEQKVIALAVYNELRATAKQLEEWGLNSVIEGDLQHSIMNLWSVLFKLDPSYAMEIYQQYYERGIMGEMHINDQGYANPDYTTADTVVSYTDWLAGVKVN